MDATARGGPAAGLGIWTGMMVIFCKSRSFPFISVYLSRALGWDVGANGGVEGDFGGDMYGFVGSVEGFGRAAFGGGYWTG